MKALYFVKEYAQWFRPGRCRLCGQWSWVILRCESAHERCWLRTEAR
jgi:hypothetical protein